MSNQAHLTTFRPLRCILTSLTIDILTLNKNNKHLSAITMSTMTTIVAWSIDCSVDWPVIGFATTYFSDKQIDDYKLVWLYICSTFTRNYRARNFVFLSFYAHTPWETPSPHTPTHKTSITFSLIANIHTFTHPDAQVWIRKYSLHHYNHHHHPSSSSWHSHSPHFTCVQNYSSNTNNIASIKKKRTWIEWTELFVVCIQRAPPTNDRQMLGRTYRQLWTDFINNTNAGAYKYQSKTTPTHRVTCWVFVLFGCISYCLCGCCCCCCYCGIAPPFNKTVKPRNQTWNTTYTTTSIYS